MDLNGFTRKELMSLIWQHPSLAQLELTRNCNQKCSFCFQGCQLNKNYQDLSLDDWKIIINKLKK